MNNTRFRLSSHAWILLGFVAYISQPIRSANAWGGNSAPVLLGIGSIFFRPRNVVLEKSLGREQILNDAGIFFTEAFWASKLGTNELSSRQSSALSKEQIAEFRRRYGKRIGVGNNNYNSDVSDRRAELIVCRDGKEGPIVGCAGIEVDRISTPNGRSVPLPGPLMSNLAIAKSYRRKGLAEDLVRAVENVARKEWGYEEFYLYVEKQNVPAVRLYRKLGYSILWEDDSAKSLIPSSRGGLESVPTTLLCMKKSVNDVGSILERILFQNR